jgi:hypothetical protein
MDAIQAQISAQLAQLKTKLNESQSLHKLEVRMLVQVTALLFSRAAILPLLY